MQTNKLFTRLYKKTSTGAIQTWKIRVESDDEANKAFIITNFGQLNGKIQETIETISEGKNVGKANETTPFQQALSQAESDWKGKLKKGYVENMDDASDGKTHEIIEGGIFPMLAHKFSEQGHKIKYPAIAEPKFDGNRCIAHKNVGVVTLWSRTRKPINSVPHIISALTAVMKDGEYFDGELYNHEYKDNFEELTHFIRQENPIDGCEIVEYHVYDFPHPTMTNLERNSYLQQLRPKFINTPIKIVESLIVKDEDELMLAFQHFLDEGYEGAMVRNCDGLYVNKRSYDLQKVKIFQDSEYEVVSVKEGKGIMAGKAIFVCKTEDGNEFSAKMIGNMDDLKKYVENPSLAVGRMLTVKYQGLTNKNNVPRFPVAQRFKIEL